MQKAMFGGGCFWCTEAIFQRLKGVKSAIPGYSGGDLPNPSYEEVSEGITGHAEAVQIEFDHKLIPYKKLLEVFFYTHDPTTPNQQGNDIGPQYRSSVFYHSAKQKSDCENFVRELTEKKVFDRSIVTIIEPFKNFYEADDYHKNYYEGNKNAMYCNYVIGPKIHKLIEKYGKDIKDEYKEK